MVGTIFREVKTMKVEYEKDRIYLLPENEKDKQQLKQAVPLASNTFCFYTFDAGKEGNKQALVITHSN
jgi:uncharacterized membrane protein